MCLRTPAPCGRVSLPSATQSFACLVTHLTASRAIAGRSHGSGVGAYGMRILKCPCGLLAVRCRHRSLTTPPRRLKGRRGRKILGSGQKTTLALANCSPIFGPAPCHASRHCPGLKNGPVVVGDQNSGPKGRKFDPRPPVRAIFQSGPILIPDPPSEIMLAARTCQLRAASKEMQYVAILIQASASTILDVLLRP